MQSKAATVGQYIASLTEDRRAIIEAVRAVILKNLDKTYAEGMQYGMIGYFVPHSVFPAGYHCDPKQPLPFAALASQKQHVSLYLMGVYCGCAEGTDSETAEARWFREAWLKTGKKLDMGRACVRFKRIEDVPLEVVGEAIRRIPASLYIERYQASIAGLKKKPAGSAASTELPASASPSAKKAAKKATKKPASKKTSAKAGAGGTGRASKAANKRK